MEDNEKALTYNLASSTQGKIFSIEYYVQLIIKHQGASINSNVNEFKNNKIIFPIKIMA